MHAVLRSLPAGLTNKLSPAAAVVIDVQATITGWAAEFFANVDGGKSEEKMQFEAILRSELFAEGKTAERLASEGFTFVIAGGETAARVLSRAIYELCRAPEVMARVKAELATAGTEAMGNLAELETLPVLVSVVSARVTYVR